MVQVVELDSRRGQGEFLRASLRPSVVDSLDISPRIPRQFQDLLIIIGREISSFYLNDNLVPDSPATPWSAPQKKEEYSLPFPRAFGTGAYAELLKRAMADMMQNGGWQHMDKWYDEQSKVGELFWGGREELVAKVDAKAPSITIVLDKRLSRALQKAHAVVHALVVPYVRLGVEDEIHEVARSADINAEARQQRAETMAEMRRYLR